MSARPLPAVSPAVPATSHAAPATAANPPPAHGGAFGSHLHDAQRQQGATDDTQAAPATNTAAQNNGAASSPAAVAKYDDKGGQADSDSGGEPLVVALATAVLGLIDRSNGDTNDSSHAATASSDAKPATTKSQTQTTGNTPAPPSPSPAAQAAVLPLPLPVPANAPAPAGKEAVSNVTALQVAVLDKTTSNAAHATQSGALPETNSKSDAATSGDAGNNGATDAASAMQGVADAAQATATSAPAGSHGAVSSAIPATASGTPPQNPADLAALHGVVAATALATPPPAPAAHALTTNAPVGTPGFARELGQQVTWLSGQDIKQAQIRLHPQELGPLDVKVSVEHGRVDIAFLAQHQAVATAVQQGLGQLNQMLGSHGLSLGNATVGQHGAQHQSGGSREHPGAMPSSAHEEANDGGTVTRLERVAVGLVDAFA